MEELAALVKAIAAAVVRLPGEQQPNADGDQGGSLVGRTMLDPLICAIARRAFDCIALI